MVGVGWCLIQLLLLLRKAATFWNLHPAVARIVRVEHRSGQHTRRRS